jgi:hypothetical protein
MEGLYNLVGPQRPSTPDQLFASLPITRKLIFSDRRIEGSSRAVGPSIFLRPNKTTRHPKSEAEPVECADENANARARRNIAIPAHLNWNEWLRWLGPPGRLPQNTQRHRRRRSDGGRFCATCRMRRNHRATRINHQDCESAILAQPRRGESGRKRLDTRGREVSRVSDE